MQNVMLALTLALAGCASAIAMPEPPPRSPEQLEEMLARYDRMRDGAARDALGLRIDETAAQRYATVSRLYWHTDLAQAKEAAHEAGKPILALRMLGRLDEDLSCANSRFFRTTLYANKEVSRYLKDNFILYWSSERPVPKVTIDFGDGRKIESTTTGNSAHYILDAQGEVLDVLPGLYAPRAFRRELAASLAHAKDLATTPAHQRGAKIISYHANKRDQINAAAAKLKVFGLHGARLSAEEALSRAQRATMSKAFVEVPQLRQITTQELKSIDEDETATWASFAIQLWPEREDVIIYPATPEPSPAEVFDAQSIALVERVYGESTQPQRTRMLGRLAQHVLADSALNQLRLRVEIATLLGTGNSDFRQVNDLIYAKVFHTPKSDPWLGLRSRVDFTGLPNDGVTMPAATAQR